MTQNTQGLSNHKKRQNALERLEELEKTVSGIENYLKSLLGHLRKSLTDLQEDVQASGNVIEALADVLGRETVEAKVKERHINKLEAQAESLQKSLDKQLEEGAFRAIDAVKEDACLVVVSETTAEGKVLHPSKLFNDISEYPEEVKKDLVGKTVGATLNTKTNSVITVLGVYERVQEEPQKEQQG